MNTKITLIFLCVCMSFTMQAAFAEVPETRIQAIFLYKFIENTNWPDNKSGLRVGFFGDTPVQAEFEKMLKARNNSNISVRKIDLSATNQCDVVFLPTSQNSKFKPLIESAKNSSILIITEDGGLIRKGAGISFLKEGESISFVVNKASLDKRRLQMTGALLSLGKQI